ncbi:nucleotidyl transferase AbiEii/AbiGii toxin family protein [Virgibacillus sp. FSP13]
MGEIINIQASEEERLRKVAEQNGRDFDSIVLLYLQERLLQRLSVSEYRNKFLLKGALFLHTLIPFRTRPTKDMNFLAGQISNDVQSIKEAFVAVCAISSEDGVTFDETSITVKRYNEGVDDEGIRVMIPASLGNLEKELQLDVHFGDVVVPKPQDLQYPTMIGMTQPSLCAYSKESAVAEKFESVLRMEADRRMKDFYDLYTLLTTENFDGRVLLEAVFETFQRRGTVLEKEHLVFSGSFAEDNANQWTTYLGRIGLEENLEFRVVMNAISNFLFPIYQAIIEENEFFKTWNTQLQAWE